MLRADYFIGIDLHKNVGQACVLYGFFMRSIH